MAIVVEGGGTNTICIRVPDNELTRFDRAEINGFQRDDTFGPGNVQAIGPQGVLDLGRSIVQRFRVQSPANEKIVFSAAGIEGEAHKTLVRNALQSVGFNAHNTEVMGDMELLTAALAHNGVAIIAGTGVNCLGEINNRSVQYGGFGPALGDEGSGFWLGRRAVNAALLQSQGWLETKLTDVVISHFREFFRKNRGSAVMEPPHIQKAYNDLESKDWGAALITLAYAEQSPEHKAILAPLAGLVIEAAADGETVAQELVVESISHLSSMIERVVTRLEPQNEITIGMRGGLFSNNYFRNQFKEAVQIAPAINQSGAQIVLFSERTHPGELDLHLHALRNV